LKLHHVPERHTAARSGNWRIAADKSTLFVGHFDGVDPLVRVMRGRQLSDRLGSRPRMRLYVASVVISVNLAREKDSRLGLTTPARVRRHPSSAE
jgi:hypothetical protein